MSREHFSGATPPSAAKKSRLPAGTGQPHAEGTSMARVLRRRGVQIESAREVEVPVEKIKIPEWSEPIIRGYMFAAYRSFSRNRRPPTGNAWFFSKLKRGRVPRVQTLLALGANLDLTHSEVADLLLAGALGHCVRRIEHSRSDRTVEELLSEYFASFPRHRSGDSSTSHDAVAWAVRRALRREGVDVANVVIPVPRIITLPEQRVEITRDWQQIAREVASRQKRLSDLSWRDFEDLVGHILTSFGWSVTPMGYTKDGGIDIIAVRRVEPGLDVNMLVQCKRFAPARKVGVEVVQQLWGVKWQKAFHHAVLATTSAFTRGARRSASMWNLELADHHAIFNWCARLARVARA
jgi:HJR/Mrr/RecB family endonuclease